MGEAAMKILLDETWMETCTRCAGQGYWPEAGTDLVIHMRPCPTCLGECFVAHDCPKAEADG